MTEPTIPPALTPEEWKAQLVGDAYETAIRDMAIGAYLNDFDWPHKPPPMAQIIAAWERRVVEQAGAGQLWMGREWLMRGVLDHLGRLGYRITPPNSTHPD